jgi:hypothetical protein
LLDTCIERRVVANMVTILITSLFILAFLAIAVYFWQKPASSIEPEALPPPPGRGLFIDATPDGQAVEQARAEVDAEVTANAVARRRELLDHAKAGEKSTLLEARNIEDAELYDEALNLLVAGADTDPKLLSLVSYVTRHELRVNQNLAERVIDSCKRVPDRSSTSKMLHVAALSDDAAVYHSAVETAVEFWRERRLTEMSTQELRSILESEFWILSSTTRSSGAGFLLKRALKSAHRELEAAGND